MKERDAVIEKNSKVKPGAPLAPVPACDTIEQNEAAEGEEPTWTVLQNWQMRHINMCMNDIEEEAKDELMELMKRTPDEFSITLSGTGFTENTVHEMSEALATDENPNLGLQRLIY